MATPANPTKVLRTTKSITDLNTFEDVLLVKTGNFAEPLSTQEALERLGNDNTKFLAAITEGMRVMAMRELNSSPDGWMQEDEEGNKTPFTGTEADTTKVNALVLTMAKTVFGYSKDATPEAKKASKESAMNFIKSNDAIKAGLKASAATPSVTV